MFIQLSEPFKIFEFDFWKRPDSHGDVDIRIKATNDGTVHAVVSWYMLSGSNIIFCYRFLLDVYEPLCFLYRWILQLDREGSIFYSTAPKWISCASKMNELQSSFTRKASYVSCVFIRLLK